MTNSESKNNPFKGIIIEYHILQTFPVTCLNRDDVGAPKSAIVGGTNRARVSSQCWKRAIRMQLQEFGVKLGIRSKRIADLIEKECVLLGATEEQARNAGEKISAILAKDTLLFFTEREAKTFAKWAKDKSFSIEGTDKAKKTKKAVPPELVKLTKSLKLSGLDGLDIALFGRMVASAKEMQIEAASGFAHAISTHKVASEIDYFTAMDDLQPDGEQGAAHLDTLEYNSATYYRYISLNLGQLYDNLGGEIDDVQKAVDVFTKAIYLAVPHARQSTMSGASAWDYAQVYLRKGQRLQLHFDTAIKSSGGYLKPSITELQNQLKQKEEQHGSLFGKLDKFQVGAEDGLNIDGLLSGLTNAIQRV